MNEVLNNFEVVCQVKHSASGKSHTKKFSVSANCFTGDEYKKEYHQWLCYIFDKIKFETFNEIPNVDRSNMDDYQFAIDILRTK